MAKPDLTRKEVLSQQDVIEFFILSRRKFYELVKQEGLGFIAYFGDRKLIIKSEFEKYLSQHPELRRREKSGRPEKRQ